MKAILSENLTLLAKNCPAPLYVVGGAVRDFLAGLLGKERDIDLCAPLTPELFIEAAKKSGFTPQAVYKNTGTVKLKDQSGADYEFTSFRSDKYVRGQHSPAEIFFTDDIVKDAKRRDFKANAVYYDIALDAFVDPLGGMDDIKKKRLSTVDDPKKVFGEDGLRLMRLARQAGQTGFIPTDECLCGAKQNAELICDISAERIYTELSYCLFADEKYGNPTGHYDAFQILKKIGVLSVLLPELALGDGMSQRSDFHRYDVLEHSLRALLYAKKNVRLAALLHDVGKPYCTLNFGNSHEHNKEGERIVREILTRLKAPKKTVEKTAQLTLFHMYDFNCETKENKLRKFFVEHGKILPELADLKQADFSGCMDDLSPCPTNRKWSEIQERMRKEHAPQTLKELKINGNELLLLGAKKTSVSPLLKRLLVHAANNPKDNTKERLLTLAASWIRGERL